MDVMTAGRMGVFADPVGAAFSVWQAGEHPGAALVNEPGTFSWSELITTDVPASKAFYGAVFGWGADTHGEGPGAYTEWQVERPLDRRDDGEAAADAGRGPAVLGRLLQRRRHRRRGRADHRARRRGDQPADGHRARPLRGGRRPHRRASFNVIAINPDDGRGARGSAHRRVTAHGPSPRSEGRAPRSSSSASREEYPDAECALVHENAFQLLAATILSAQTTDENVNKVTPQLFARYPTPRDLAHADPEDVEAHRALHRVLPLEDEEPLGMARTLDEDFGGEVPTELDDLVKLPGRRAQDRQRRAVGRVRPARACPSTRTSGGCRAGSSSPTRPTR